VNSGNTVTDYAAPTASTHHIASRDEWLEARRNLLLKEKALTRQRDALSAERRALPWVKVQKDYVFDTLSGKVSFSQLFNGRTQLFIKHYMMGPGQTQHCVSCALEVDHIGGLLAHLENHDVTYTAVARAPLSEIETLRKRMDWRFPWVSSYGSDFNYDFNVSFTPEQLAARSAVVNFRMTDPGLEDLSGNSVFYKDKDGQIFHTYSSFGRGGEEFLGIYRYFDVMPMGRNETGPYHSLGDWVRPHDMYGKGGMVEGNGRYHLPTCACAGHRPAPDPGSQTLASGRRQTMR
jgi:predicted dithiol-disulfide oxidoreductase (DUF899 family)